jgi:uncharacterized protein (UPF0335 family)
MMRDLYEKSKDIKSAAVAAQQLRELHDTLDRLDAIKLAIKQTIQEQLNQTSSSTSANKLVKAIYEYTADPAAETPELTFKEGIII